MTNILDKVKDKAKQWLDSATIDAETKAQVQLLLDSENTQDLINNFYKDLEFGTGGLRGIMGAGTNCINKYTIGVATQGLSNYLIKTYPGKKLKVALANDSRNNSPYFKQITADVFSANGIEVHMFSDLRPTPLLSFAIRYLKCDSGIVITASHNPKEYNGYKVYWNDGAQVVPPHDINIIEEVKKITSFEEVRFQADKSEINIIGSEVEEAYYHEVEKIIPKRESIKRHHTIPIVYTSIHGAGITMVPECLNRIGFTNIHIVEEQAKPDGDFPTVVSPNPEERSALELAIKKGIAIGATMVMATDPDGDRVGVGIRKPNGEFILLNGNEAFSLMMWFIMRNVKNKNNAYIIKTIVTTELVDKMAQTLGIECFNTLTGFKHIASLMRELEDQKTFVAAGEESYGYMAGDFVRDKDAVSACAFFAAMAASAADENKSLHEWLIEMYVEFNLYKEGLINIVKKGQQGEQQIKSIMEKYRNSPPSHIINLKVVRILDYLTLSEKHIENNSITPLNFPVSDVIQFYLEDGTKISIRPSGTEPKIKFYVSVHAPLISKNDFESASQILDQKIKTIEQSLIN